MKKHSSLQKSSTYNTLNDWIEHESIPISLDSSEEFNKSIDKVITSISDSVELLGLGEALHGGEEILILRNQLFKHLVEAHGYSAIAIESSFPKAHLVNDYINGHGTTSYEDVQDTGFSHGFGKVDANRELVEWMREYNADPSHQTKLQFYGFDSPTEMTHSDSPREVLYFVLDYLTAVDNARGKKYKERMDELIGQDSDWENPDAMMDPTKSIGLSPSATALRIETENLISELHIRRPGLVAKSDESRYLEALHYAIVARQLLNYHATLAQKSEPGKRIIDGLGIRDAVMANNLEYIVLRERYRGKVLAFAHNSHLKYREAQWQLGIELLTWWPAGAHLKEILGPRYAVIGSTVGVSDANGIGQPETGTLEEQLINSPGPVRFIPTHQGNGLPTPEIEALPTRSGSTKNFSYFPLSSQSFTDFDWFVALDSTTYSRGGPALQQ
ncbi:erythromycin esterase family protein [Methanobacterium sp.]|uniref:erythromycin esterase family protein n=1 Tax=Methanobacterium sp. TaxID=2164 RepID=UPI003C75F849